MSEFVEHIPCDQCGSSDANALFSDGHTWCYSCETYVPGDVEEEKDEPQKNKKNKSLLKIERVQALEKRELLKETCEKFGYGLARDKNGELVQVAPYRNQNGKVVAQKVRGRNKEFYTTGEFKDVQLFGQHLFKNSGGKRLIITEGEVDALSAYQMIGSWPVVSLPNGASGAAKSIKANLEFVESYDKVVLCFDQDEVGQKAAEEVAELLTPGKASIMSLSEKDANDMLKANKVQEFVKAFWEARSFEPDGIINGSDLWDEVSADAEMGPSLPWDGVNSMSYGQRPGELWTWTSGSGMGKSEFVAKIAYHNLIEHGETVGYVALEENCGRTGKRLMAQHLGKPIHLPGVTVSAEERRKAFEATTGSGRVWMYDHWGSQEGDRLISKIRFLIKAKGCTTIILDHLSIIVSGLDDGDERKTIDIIMTQLRSLVEETGVKMHLVSHLKRPMKGKGHEEGAQVSLAHLRGSHSIVQLSDFVIGLERNQQAKKKSNITKIRVLKNRYAGLTGLASAVEYDAETGLLNEVPIDDVEEDGEAHDYGEALGDY